jgi:hypothetical protein
LNPNANSNNSKGDIMGAENNVILVPVQNMKEKTDKDLSN